MAHSFKRVTLYGRQRHGISSTQDTLRTLSQSLLAAGVEVMIEADTAQLLPSSSLPIIRFADLDQQCDLLIVVGGDGSMLQAIRAAAKFAIPVLGINRGRLGFLTDIAPDEIEARLEPILAGKYYSEQRFMLHAEFANSQQDSHAALNDVVLLPGNQAQMIEFEIFINGKAVCSQRADGLIIATPTGSTAYALSGGGPILHPSLNAIVLVPMFPHTLSSRPVVVSADSQIEVLIDKNTDSAPGISCDGQEKLAIAPGEHFKVSKYKNPVQLIHPLDYDYYETLRQKLKWETKH
jgi:NAD+ kinase